MPSEQEDQVKHRMTSHQLAMPCFGDRIAKMIIAVLIKHGDIAFGLFFFNCVSIYFKSDIVIVSIQRLVKTENKNHL